MDCGEPDCLGCKVERLESENARLREEVEELKAKVRYHEDHAPETGELLNQIKALETAIEGAVTWLEAQVTREKSALPQLEKFVGRLDEQREVVAKMELILGSLRAAL